MEFHRAQVQLHIWPETQGNLYANPRVLSLCNYSSLVLWPRIPVASLALIMIFVDSVHWDFSPLLGLLLPIPQSKKYFQPESWGDNFLFSLNDQNHDLNVVQCLKTVLYILSSSIVVYSGRTSPVAVTHVFIRQWKISPTFF